jgi:hypothetical protein
MLAMVHHRLGNADTARHWLAEGTQLMETGTKDAPAGVHWLEWERCLLWRTEAEGLVGVK